MCRVDRLLVVLKVCEFSSWTVEGLAPSFHSIRPFTAQTRLIAWLLLPLHGLIWPCDCHCQLPVPMAKLASVLALIGSSQAMSLFLQCDWWEALTSRPCPVAPPLSLPVPKLVRPRAMNMLGGGPVLVLSEYDCSSPKPCCLHGLWKGYRRSASIVE